MASGCSAWTSSDRNPATGADRSPFSRHVTLPGPKNPSSAGLSGTLAVNAAAARSTRPAVGNTSAVIASPPGRDISPARHQRYLATGGPPTVRWRKLSRIIVVASVSAALTSGLVTVGRLVACWNATSCAWAYRTDWANCGWMSTPQPRPGYVQL